MPSNSNKPYIVIAAIAAVVLVGSIMQMLLTVRAQVRDNATVAWVVHTYQVMETLRDLEDSLSTHAADQTTRVSIVEHYDELKRLTADNPRQQVRLAIMHPYLNQVMRTHPGMRNQIVGPASGNAKDANLAVESLIDAMFGEEQRLLALRTTAWHRASAHYQESIARVFLVGVFIIVLAALLAATHIQHRMRSEHRLAESAKRLEREHASLSSVTHFLQSMLNAELDLDRVLVLVCKQSQELTGAQGAAVEMVRGDNLEYRATVGMLEGSVGMLLPLRSSLSGLCVEQRQVLRSDDTESDDRVNAETRKALSIRSVIVVPLFADNACIGVLKVASSARRSFNDDHVDALTLMAGVIAVAIERANQFAHLQQAQESLKVEMERIGDLNIVLEFQRERLQAANAALENLATLDGLTGLKNHRALQEKLANEYAMATFDSPFCVAMVDIDRFKSFNDEFGHPAGDDVLRSAASLLTRSVRECDFVARYGGEEFALILNNIDAHGGLQIAESCRAAMESAPWDRRQITASFGLAVFDPTCSNPSELVRRADEALYASKATGRNQVTVWADVSQRRASIHNPAR